MVVYLVPLNLIVNVSKQSKSQYIWLLMKLKFTKIGFRKVILCSIDSTWYAESFEYKQAIFVKV